MIDPPAYLVSALRAIDPELRLRYDPAAGLFGIVRKPYGCAMEQVVRVLRTPSWGMVWPDWANTVEWVLESDWGGVRNDWDLDRFLNTLVEDPNRKADHQVDAAAADRIHGELRPMSIYAMKKGMRPIGARRA